jgi:hypothetical protein
MTGQVFHIFCNNLKPSTLHNFNYEGVNSSANCVVTLSGVNYGLVSGAANGLYTDSSGKIEFDFYSGISNSDSIITGIKKFEIFADNSYASGTINIVNTVVTITVPSPTPAPTTGLARGVRAWRDGVVGGSLHNSGFF